MGTLLFLVSIILTFTLYPLGFIYSVIKLSLGVKFKTLLKRVDDLFSQVSIAVDELGNVFMREPFNDLLLKNTTQKTDLGADITIYYYPFGKVGETISSVLGKNKQTGTLKFLGKALCWLLDKIQKNHVEISIQK